MTEALPELRARLERQKAELSERLAKIKEDIAGGLERDAEEQAGQLENREVLDALANEATAELEQINAALRRMDEGTYGTCTACGEAIDARRLEARPYASLCMRCA